MHDGFDENDNIFDGYDLDECQLNIRLEIYAYWSIINKYNWNMRDYIAIVQLEVK